MKEKIILLIKHPLLSGSSIILFGSFLANILNWIFNLYIGGRHLLSPSEYGIYSSLMSILGFIGIIQITFTSIFAKYAAQFSVQDNKKNYAALLVSGGKLILIFSSIVILFLLIFSSNLANFLHITDIRLVWLMIFALFFSLLSALPAGILQGELKFLVLSLFLFSAALLKLLFGFLFIFLGMNIYGVMIAVLLSTFFPLLCITLPLSRRLNTRNIKEIDQKVFIKEFRGYSLSFFLATLGITVFSSLDIVFVKHFFSSEMSGYYAALSIMGKSIFYLTSPIYYVFFPLITQKFERKENITGTLLLTTGVILLISLSLSGFYFLWPQIILRIFFPAKEYAFLASYLGIYSLFVAIFSMVMLFNNFLLSIGRTQVYIINLLGGLFFIILISLFHATLLTIIYILSFTALMILVSQILFYYIKK